MKKIILLIPFILFACNENPVNDLAGVSHSTNIDINYLNNGRVYNLNTGIDSVNYSDNELIIYSERTYQIHRDNIINYKIK